ncbi:hypothetical protein CVT24_005288 [Panaeolus cyanescens]|uniref:Uncharacterized protein n=1 Tax=Panaeolus cyanescens TaxID=181874 RepID=A0A409Y947_9AGAR|nr:hypothetical protein CVT24_005288 [Panaeolus cyanescens]
MIRTPKSDTNNKSGVTEAGTTTVTARIAIREVKVQIKATASSHPAPSLKIIVANQIAQTIEAACRPKNIGDLPLTRKERAWIRHENRMKAFSSPQHDAGPPPRCSVPRATSLSSKESHSEGSSGTVNLSLEIERSRRAFQAERDCLHEELMEEKQRFGKLALFTEIVSRMMMMEAANVTGKSDVNVFKDYFQGGSD